MPFRKEPKSTIVYGTRLKSDDRAYDRERRLRYPDTYREDHPDERAERDYRDYSALTDKSNATNNAYVNLHTQEREKFNNYGRDNAHYDEEKKYYRQNRAALFPDQHERLIEPSQQRHEASLRSVVRISF